MNIVTVGIDLAKNIFALHGIDQSGKQFIEAESSARPIAGNSRPPATLPDRHGSLLRRAPWAKFSRFGHTVKPDGPKFVAPCPDEWQARQERHADAAAIL